MVVFIFVGDAEGEALPKIYFTLNKVIFLQSDGTYSLRPDSDFNMALIGLNTF